MEVLLAKPLAEASPQIAEQAEELIFLKLAGIGGLFCDVESGNSNNYIFYGRSGKNEKLIGIGTIEIGVNIAFSTTATTELGLLEVAREQRGRGYGRQMLRSLENKARAAGQEKMHVDSVQNAIGFYRRCGYQSVSSQTPSKLVKCL